MRVSGVILAAGGSSRLGRPKQLLQLAGEPMVRIVTRQALASRLDEVILVTGAAATEVAAAAGNLGQRTILNSDYAQGQSSSLRAGLAAVSPDADAVLFLLGDSPEVGPERIDALVAAFNATESAIVQPSYGGVPGNPVLFARTLFGDLANVTGDEGARSLLKRHADKVTRVEVPGGPAPGDVDTEEDYNALVARWSLRSNP